MIGVLEDRKAALLVRLDEVHDEKQETLDEQKTAIQNLVHNISNTCGLTEETLEHGTDTQVRCL